MKFVLRYLSRLRPPEFLVIRHPPFNLHQNDVIIDWVHEHAPELSALFQLRELPYAMSDRSNIVLHIPWLQDPVQRWSEEVYRLANNLADECDARGIPVINRVDRLINATKSVGSKLMAAAGVRTPLMATIDDPEEFRETLLGLPLPLFVREDWRHAGPMLRANTREEARALPLEQFRRPVAIELFDFPDRRDGLYRKYRYVAAGDIGVSHHLQISKEWVTKGGNRVKTDLTREEELAYIAKPDPNHELLQRARKALGLDLVALDYSYHYDGSIVVWEANPYPYIQFSTKNLKYRNHAIHRTIQAVVEMYLRRASLPVPEALLREY